MREIPDKVVMNALTQCFRLDLGCSITLDHMRAAAAVILEWAEERHGQEMMILSKDIETMRQEADAIHAKILELHALTMKQAEGEDD